MHCFFFLKLQCPFLNLAFQQGFSLFHSETASVRVNIDSHFTISKSQHPILILLDFPVTIDIVDHKPPPPPFFPPKYLSSQDTPSPGVLPPSLLLLCLLSYLLLFISLFLNCGMPWGSIKGTRLYLHSLRQVISSNLML